MTTSYLDRKPNARGKSIAWRVLRDAKTAQLAAETRALRKPWAVVRAWNALTGIFREGFR